MIPAVLLLAAFLVVRDAAAWETTLASLGDRHDIAFDVAVGPRGEVVAAGVTRGEEGQAALLVVKLEAATGAVAWSLDIGGRVASAVAIDGARDILVAGWLGDDPTSFLVMKLDGASGAVRWEYRGLTGYAAGVAVTSTGDVFAAGSGARFGDEEVRHRFVVVGLDSATGVARWEHVSEAGAADALALGPTGNVVAGGYLYRPFRGGDFWVTQLAGATGEPLWERGLRGSSSELYAGGSVGALAVDRAGDVIAAGQWSNRETDYDLAVVKLAGDTGLERWRRSLDGEGTSLGGSDDAHGVALDSRGNVVVVGRLEDSGTEAFAVAKLAGADGRLCWRRAIAGSVVGHDVGAAVALDHATDDVYAAGQTASAAVLDFTVLKLSHDDGTELWRRTAPGAASSIALDPAADVVAAGYADGGETLTDFRVVTLAGATGGEPPCAALCRLDAAAALLRAADAQALDPALAERLAMRLERARRLLGRAGASPRRGRGQLVDFVGGVKRLLRREQIARLLGRRLVALVEPLLAR